MKMVLNLVTHFKIQEMGKNLILSSRFLCLSNLYFFQALWLILIWLVTTYHLWRTGTFVSSEYLGYFKSLFCQLDAYLPVTQIWKFWEKYLNLLKKSWMSWKKSEILVAGIVVFLCWLLYVNTCWFTGRYSGKGCPQKWDNGHDSQYK